MGLDQHVGRRHVAADRRDAAPAQAVDDLAILFGDHQRQLALEQRFADAAANAPIADQQHMARQEGLVGGARQLGERIVALLEAAGGR